MMSSIGKEVLFVLVVLGITFSISFIAFKIIGGYGLVLGAIIFVAVVMPTVRLYPVGWYLAFVLFFTANVVVANKNGDRKPIYFLKSLPGIFLGALVVFGALYIVSGFIGVGGDSHGSCTRFSPQFC